jgi:hypothetical protein
MEVRFQRSLLPIITITISPRHLDDDFENNSLINKAEQEGGGQNFDQLTFFSFFSKKNRSCSIGLCFSSKIHSSVRFVTFFKKEHNKQNAEQEQEEQ